MSYHTVSLLALVIALLVQSILRQINNVVRINLLTDAVGNEVLIISGTISGKQMFFMIDTAYAGAPVLSTSYLSLPQSSPLLSLQDQYRLVVDGLQKVTSQNRNEALAQFLQKNYCH